MLHRLALVLVLLAAGGYAWAQTDAALLRAADSLEAQHRYRQAAAQLDLLIQRNPTQVAYLDRRSRLLQCLDEHTRAFIDLERADALDGPRAYRHYQRALMHVRLQSRAYAREAIQAGLKLDPKGADLYALLSDLELAANQPKAAQAAAQKALRIERQHPLALHTLARLDLLAGREADARKGFEAVLEADSAHGLTCINLAALLLRSSEDTARAVRLLLGVRDLRFAPSAAGLLAGIYEATAATQPDAPRQQATRLFIEHCVDQRPCLTAHHVWLIERWAAAGDTARALLQAQRMRAALPNCAPAEHARDFKNLALCLAYDCNDEAAALALIDSLQAAGTFGTEQARAVRAGVHLSRKDYLAAEAVLDESFLANPRNPELLNLRIDNLVRLERIEQAIEVLGLALAARDTCARCLFQRGLFRMELRDSAGSFADLLAAREQGYSALGLHNNIGLLRMYYERDTSAALAEFDRSIAEFPDFAYAYNNKGYLLLHRGRAEEALAAVNRSLQLDSRNSQAYFYRALIHERMGRDRSDLCADLNQAQALLDEEASTTRRIPWRDALRTNVAAARARLCPGE